MQGGNGVEVHDVGNVSGAGQLQSAEPGQVPESKPDQPFKPTRVSLVQKRCDCHKNNGLENSCGCQPHRKRTAMTLPTQPKPIKATQVRWEQPPQTPRSNPPAQQRQITLDGLIPGARSTQDRVYTPDAAPTSSNQDSINQNYFNGLDDSASATKAGSDSTKKLWQMSKVQSLGGYGCRPRESATIPPWALHCELDQKTKKTATKQQPRANSAAKTGQKDSQPAQVPAAPAAPTTQPVDEQQSPVSSSPPQTPQVHPYHPGCTMYQYPSYAGQRTTQVDPYQQYAQYQAYLRNYQQPTYGSQQPYSYPSIAQAHAQVPAGAGSFQAQQAGQQVPHVGAVTSPRTQTPATETQQHQPQTPQAHVCHPVQQNTQQQADAARHTPHAAEGTHQSQQPAAPATAQQTVTNPPQTPHAHPNQPSVPPLTQGAQSQDPQTTALNQAQVPQHHPQVHPNYTQQPYMTSPTAYMYPGYPRQPYGYPSYQQTAYVTPQHYQQPTQVAAQQQYHQQTQATAQQQYQQPTTQVAAQQQYHQQTQANGQQQYQQPTTQAAAQQGYQQPIQTVAQQQRQQTTQPAAQKQQQHPRQTTDHQKQQSPQMTAQQSTDPGPARTQQQANIQPAFIAQSPAQSPYQGNAQKPVQYPTDGVPSSSVDHLVDQLNQQCAQEEESIANYFRHRGATPAQIEQAQDYVAQQRSGGVEFNMTVQEMSKMYQQLQEHEIADQQAATGHQQVAPVYQAPVQ